MSEVVVVERSRLRIGELLAEGGEGRVFELPLQPHLVYKAYRSPIPRGSLDELVGWPDEIHRPDLAARVHAAAAWPAAVVVEEGSPTHGSGLLLPRAPRRFAVRHRDGTTRLSTLSYLTADPGHRAAAYGLDLPPAASSERLGLVYALARLLEAFETSQPSVGHGDLSTKNVLWSLQRGPEVFVLDCDNGERYDPDGRALGPPGRRRAMTPNWEDPAIDPGGNPTRASDRYSLALIFLRVVGAAHFPLQGRQRLGEPLTVQVELPRGRVADALADPAVPLWDLCGRGLSVREAAARPSAAAWAAALEAALDAVGAAPVAEVVRANQGGADGAGPAGGPAGHGAPRRGSPPPDEAPRPGGPPDVTVVPVVVAPRVTTWRRGTPPVPPPPRPPAAPGPGRPGPPAARPAAPAPAPEPLLAPLRRLAGQGGAWWLARHRRVGSLLRSPGSRSTGLWRLAGCLAVDLALGALASFVVAMLVAPFLGI